MNSDLTLSVVINNYNYERYVGHAIQSALAQTYESTEVVVVDDGSTDDSRSIIESFGEAIVPVFKENGGQASAMNRGVRAASGDVIIFLDADDALEPTIGELVVEEFRREPDLAKVQFRLRVVDGELNDLDRITPPPWQELPNGDLRAFVARHRTYVYPPTSGNAFSRRALDLMGPIPEQIYRISADQYLHHSAPLTGTIRALDLVGGIYRIHASNHYATADVNLQRMRNEINISCEGHPYLRDIAERTGLFAYPREYRDVQDRILLGLRLTSLKLDPAGHPVSEDTLPGLCFRAIGATLRTPGISGVRKAIQSGWIIAVSMAPASLARSLAGQRFELVNPKGTKSGYAVRLHKLVVYLMSRARGVHRN